MKRLLSLLIIAFAPVSMAFGGYTFCCNGIYYNTISSKTVEVTYCSNTNFYKNAIIIPDIIEYGWAYRVVSIGEEAFKDCSGLTSITIPNSVTSIKNKAFSGCSGLTSITIPNSVTSIGNFAFQYCNGLSSVTMGSGVTSIGSYAFRGCSGLTSITIPNSVTSIKNNAFSGCSGLTSITIPNSVKYILNYVFSDCSGLISITLPSSITTIYEGTFSGCSGLTSITIPNSVTSISDGAFAYCSGLTSITIPNSVTSIGHYAFRGCGLTSVTIPNSVTTIGSDAFKGCSGLSSVTIGKGVTSIGDLAFYKCSGLTSVTILCRNVGKWFSYPTIKEIILGDEVEKIGAYAFYGCTGIKSIIIPNSVTSIGDVAFYGCSGLSSVTIGKGVTSFGALVFNNCSALTSVTILCRIVGNWLQHPTIKEIILGDGVENISDNAFSDCSGLTSVTMGKSVTYIGEKAFHDCEGLTSIISLNTTPPKLEDNTFPNYNATLYVPTGYKGQYWLQQYWNNFTNVVEIDASNIQYTLTYLVDGEIYKTYKLKVGDTITPEAEPTKEGYTFSGWSEIPSIMPDHDVTVSGTFTKNGSGTDDDNPSNYKSLDDYIANSNTTLQNYSYTINPIIKNIKKVYIDLTKGTTNSAYCYLWIENNESTKRIDISSKYVSTSSDNFIVHENNKSKSSNIKKLVDNKTYSWLYYNPKNSNEAIIDVEAFFGCLAYIKGWQKNFGTSFIVNIAPGSDTSIQTSIFNENSQPPIIGGTINAYSDGTIKEKGIIISDNIDKLVYDANSKVLIFGDNQLKDYKVIDCTEIGKEQYWCPILNLKSNKDYYVKAYAIQSDGSIIYGQTEKIHSQTFNRYNGTTDYANVYYYNNYTLFDLVTDEIIPKEDGYYGSTNENPTKVAFKPSYACYKFKNEWNYKLWYYNGPHCVQSKKIHPPLITQLGNKLHVEKNPLDSNKNITIYYSINGDYFRPENYNNIYSSPIEISEACAVYCYGISSDGYISYTNMYVVNDSSSSSAISTPYIDSNKDDKYYNLQGQRVLYPRNGIYIKNGKKIFIK